MNIRFFLDIDFVNCSVVMGNFLGNKDNYNYEEGHLPFAPHWLYYVSIFISSSYCILYLKIRRVFYYKYLNETNIRPIF